MRPILWSLVYSPWSERARWALEHCGVEYTRVSYKPLIGELGLRRKLRRWRGPVSVPILETAAGVLDDSFLIAQYADAHATNGRRIIPDEHRAAISDYNELAGRAMSAGRVLGLERLLGNERGLLDMVPRKLQSYLGPLAVPIAARGIRRTIRKYAAVTPEAPVRTLSSVLARLRDNLDGSPVLLGELTYADMTMAQVLAFVEPPRTHLRLTEATRDCYTDVALAEEYADLVRWRDELYASHREH